ncbi:hypothetical protein Hanom_Chr01g00004361 [Helianthus anomalus]
MFRFFASLLPASNSIQIVCFFHFAPRREQTGNKTKTSGSKMAIYKGLGQNH